MLFALCSVALKSSEQNVLTVPHACLKTHGKRAFGYRAVALWSALPQSLHWHCSQTTAYCFSLAVCRLITCSNDILFYCRKALCDLDCERCYINKCILKIIIILMIINITLVQVLLYSLDRKYVLFLDQSVTGLSC